MTKRPNQPDVGPPPHDQLDALLRSWHDVNATRAADGRDRLMARIRRERQQEQASPAAPGLGEALATFAALLRSAIVNRYAPVAASLVLVVALITLLVPGPQGQVYADDVIMMPEAGKLEAFDGKGNMVGPCPLEHTDVKADISGFLGRVRLTQTYFNPYPDKVEAVYTFPLSHRAAVDRMTMTIGDRVVVAEVKERELARRIYQAARDQGYVASLLEQERPNIFTQSVANIEPGAEVVVEISYVEILRSADGTFTFDFPMVVGPRYIPGAPTASPSVVPAELTPRQGVVLLGPARLTVGAAGEVADLGTLQGGKLEALIDAARPIAYPGDQWWGRGGPTGGAGQPTLWHRFEATYTDGATELGELHTDGTGRINGRWFYTDPAVARDMGTGFAQDTNQVPDAGRITPTPVKPGTRAGHDIGVTVTIDTGGPGIANLNSALHDIRRTRTVQRPDGLPRSVTVTLADQAEIPNRDFVLSWRTTADVIQEATFTHTTDDLGEFSGGFFTMILQPPDRVEPAEVRARELVFVMDTSGSMRGFPIEKSKEVMTRAIDAMRPSDTFNVIAFSGHTAPLWGEPRPATRQNRAEALAFVTSRGGGGGTEMMAAINSALVQAPEHARFMTPEALADLPADGRAVTVRVDAGRLVAWPPPWVRSSWSGTAIQPEGGTAFEVSGLPSDPDRRGTVQLTGRWVTRNQRRILDVDHRSLVGAEPTAPMRIAMFLTDGYVGNDMAIIDAVRRNARTTRVFSLGIGNSVNRYLLEGMARAGRGEVEFVLLDSDADEAVERLTKRIETPVLTDIELSFGDGLEVFDLLPPPDAIPDLFDVGPLVIQGRYRGSGRGAVTVRGRTGAGPYERTVPLELPESQPEHDVIATLWGRAKVEQVMAPHLQAVQQGHAPAPVRDEIVALGERFGIMTQFTSFVAVEKTRLTIGGKPVLVAVPIEMPDGVSYDGVFGEPGDDEEPMTVAAGQSGAELSQLMSRSLLKNMPGKDQRQYNLAPPPPAAAPPSEPTHARAKRGSFGAGSSGAGTPGGAKEEAAGPSTAFRDERSGERAQDLELADKLSSADAPDSSTRHANDPSLTGGRRPAPQQPARESEAQAVGELKAAGLNEQIEGDYDGHADDVSENGRLRRVAGAEARDELFDGGGATTPDNVEKPDHRPAPAETAPSLDLDRLSRVRQVLDASLLATVSATETARSVGQQDDAELLITVLVAKIDSRLRRALEAAGLKIEAVSRSLPVIVGRASIADLEAIALVDGVRRVERTRMTNL